MMYRAFFLFLTCGLFADPYVTYQVSGGRFGDHVTNYLQAKWVSYTTGYPLIVRPFDNIEALRLSQIEPKINVDIHKLHHIFYENEQPDLKVKPGDLLFVRHFTSITADVTPDNYWFPSSFLVDWRDRKFLSLARELVAPAKPLNLLEIENEGLSIAIHYREGGTFQLDHAQKGIYPTRFVPFSFYLEALEGLIDELKPEKLSIALFTDAVDRQSIKEQLDRFLEHPQYNVVLAPGGVLEDFFSLAKFPYVIHAESLFSINATRLGKCALAIHPQLFCYSQGRGTKYVSPVAVDMGYKEEINTPVIYLECATNDFEEEMMKVMRGLAYCREQGSHLEVAFTHSIFDNLKASFLKKRREATDLFFDDQEINWKDPVFLALARNYFSPKIAPEIPISEAKTSAALIVSPYLNPEDYLEALPDVDQVTLVFFKKKDESFIQKIRWELRKKGLVTHIRSLVISEVHHKAFLAIGHHTHVLTPRNEFVEAAAHLFSPHPPTIIR